MPAPTGPFLLPRRTQLGCEGLVTTTPTPIPGRGGCAASLMAAAGLRSPQSRGRLLQWGRDLVLGGQGEEVVVGMGKVRMRAAVGVACRRGGGAALLGLPGLSSRGTQRDPAPTGEQSQAERSARQHPVCDGPASRMRAAAVAGGGSGVLPRQAVCTVKWLGVLYFCLHIFGF